MSGLAKIEVSLETYKAIEAARLSVVEDHDAIIRRVLLSRTAKRDGERRTIARSCAPATRKRGNISVSLFGRSQSVANLKGAYVATLIGLLRHKPSLFERLAQEGTARRRWIAREASALYPESPHLARDHALALAGDWFLDTNLSRVQIDQRLLVACRIAGYWYGDDVVIVGG
jgi:hypothetical protein